MNQKPRPRPAKLIRCSICFGEMSLNRRGQLGHSAQPVNDGQCCDHCDATVVEPTRARWTEDDVIKDMRKKGIL